MTINQPIMNVCRSGISKVSVCMATYQGERYIAAQLNSILCQLSSEDEVIIVDDASTDDTVRIIEGFQDSRIHLMRSPVNRGVLRTFEDAIRRATGEIIFLSDQDDLWEPDKVCLVIGAFFDHPEATLVVSDATTIDEEGVLLEKSYYGYIGRFDARLWSNLIHCKFLGATMAFRASLLPSVLPFPKHFDVLHDIWIGARNAFSGGMTVFLNQPLVLYRRHSRNVSRRRRLAYQLWIRLQLLLSLSAFAILNRDGGHRHDMR